MTDIRQILAERGPMEAIHIAYITGESLESTYTQLVRLECQGRVRVRLHRCGVRDWVLSNGFSEPQKVAA